MKTIIYMLQCLEMCGKYDLYINNKKINIWVYMSNKIRFKEKNNKSGEICVYNKTRLQSGSPFFFSPANSFYILTK
ncbi:hypothetical protein YYG_00321 [Plasmodium vinckei petteri]|uniref:Uncharacterized protein n=1 Tax=Plasmodium vinckei petteri TaxID=138298 RepID=W7B8K0_PLAVN|nr:hypothetical protein YYG_00321 [Plasmodium vinckei petteri]